MKQTEIVRNRIKLQHLKVLMAVAQSGSMAKAAKTLAISQPVVSKVIADLEALLEVRLFDRSPQGVEPTRYARSLLRHSVGILDGIRTGIEEIRFLADPGAGELRMGSTEPLLAGLVTSTVERLWMRHPGVALRVSQADAATLINRELLERRIELAVIPLIDPLTQAELSVDNLYSDHWHVVAGNASPWLRRRAVTLADLVDAPWCATPLDTTIGSLLVDPFRALGLPAPRLAVASVMSPQLVVRLLRNGRLVAVIADSLLNFFLDKQLPVKKLPVELATRPFNVAIVTLKNKTISPVAQTFIDCAHEIAGELEQSRLKQATPRAGRKRRQISRE